MRGKLSLSRALAVAILALGYPEPTWALRPLETEDSPTVGAGKLELELGANYTGDEEEEGGVAGTLTLGVLSWFHDGGRPALGLEVDLCLPTGDSDRGLGNPG